MCFLGVRKQTKKTYMYKNVKFKMVALAIGVLATMFISCSKNDDEISKLIVGQWQLIETNDSNYEDACFFDGWLAFKNDETCTVFDACVGVTTTGTYVIVGRSIALANGDGHHILGAYIVSISTNELILNFNGEGLTYKYKKIHIYATNDV